MRDTMWNNILHLLCIAILIDGKVYKEEVDTFLYGAKLMNTRISPGMVLTDHMLLDWFQTHRDIIKLELETQLRSEYLRRHIMCIDDPAITHHMLQCMYDISTSDRKLHNSEVSLVTLAAQMWQLPNISRDADV